MNTKKGSRKKQRLLNITTKLNYKSKIKKNKIYLFVFCLFYLFFVSSEKKKKEEKKKKKSVPWIPTQKKPVPTQEKSFPLRRNLSHSEKTEEYGAIPRNKKSNRTHPIGILTIFPLELS